MDNLKDSHLLANTRRAAERRRFVARLFSVMAAPWLVRAGTAQTEPVVVSVIDRGAKGDGVSDDSQAIIDAIRVASEHRGSRVVFPRGTYRLKYAVSGESVPLNGLADLHLQGEDAVLLCETPAGTTSMLKLTDCENVSIRGLTFHDLGANRNVDWKGAVAIYLTGYGERGNRNIRIESCRFENVLAALMVSDAGGQRAAGLRLSSLDIRNSYYGLNFQGNGDDVVATGIHCNDVKRSYFPYGVTNHRIELSTDQNSSGFTDVLIKCYGRETGDLEIKLRCRGKRGGDAIVALDQQHPDDLGVIRDIKIDLDASAIDWRLDNIVMLRAFSVHGTVLPNTRSEWRGLTLRGHANYFPWRTRMLSASSEPEVRGTIAMSRDLLRRVDPSQVRGFSFVPAEV